MFRLNRNSLHSSPSPLVAIYVRMYARCTLGVRQKTNLSLDLSSSSSSNLDLSLSLSLFRPYAPYIEIRYAQGIIAYGSPSRWVSFPIGPLAIVYGVRRPLFSRKAADTNDLWRTRVRKLTMYGAYFRPSRFRQPVFAARLTSISGPRTLTINHNNLKGVPSMGVLNSIASGNRPKTSAELRSILGEYHEPCPKCGCGTAGVADDGSLVCFGCREDLYDSPRFAIRVFLKRTSDCPPGKYLVVDWDDELAAFELRQRREDGGAYPPATHGRGAIEIDFDRFYPDSRPWGYRANGTKPATPSGWGLGRPLTGTVEDWQNELKQTARGEV